MAFARMDDVITIGACGCEHGSDRLDGRAGERQIVAHAVHIAAFAAEIRLHIDDDERGVLGRKIAVERPRIWIGRNRRDVVPI